MLLLLLLLLQLMKAVGAFLFECDMECEGH